MPTRQGRARPAVAVGSPVRSPVACAPYRMLAPRQGLRRSAAAPGLRRADGRGRRPAARGSQLGAPRAAPLRRLRSSGLDLRPARPRSGGQRVPGLGRPGVRLFRAAARSRSISSIAAELRRLGLRPLLLLLPVSFQFPSMAAALADAARRGDGGTGYIRRPRARPVAAAAGSGGLDVRLGRWRRAPRAPSRPFLARPPPPLLPGRRPWRVPARGNGGEQVPGKRRGGAAAAAPPGAAARPQDHGDEAADARAEGEGLRVNFPLVEVFLQKT